MKKRYFSLVTGLSAALFLLITCTPKPFFFRSGYTDTNALMHQRENLQKEEFLKAHLKNGEVHIFRETWSVDTIQDIVTGRGSSYDYNRNKISEGLITIPIDSVAIFETNSKLEGTEKKRVRALAIMAGVDVALGVFCISTPKACFGSCPTFYIEEEDNFHYADAEGFSTAISPSMQYSDIDALKPKFISGNSFAITMKNEALETHVVNSLNLIAFPLKQNERVYQSPQDEFYACRNNYSLKKAVGGEGEMTGLLQKADRKERFSFADEENLSSKEEIYLTYENVELPNSLGLVLSFRQTLMTTYFIYSAMGYMGDEVGDIFARIETSGTTAEKLKNGIKKELGNIDVYVWNPTKENWEFQGGYYETGPIAFNRQILPFSSSVTGEEIRVKLVLNKGLWRLDHAALTNVIKKLDPVLLDVCEVKKKGITDPTAKAEILERERSLISMPGNEYQFIFEVLGEAQEYELFLVSGGYYLEWMRESWIKDKNLLKLKQMVDYPRRYLKVEAKNYKDYERTMEQEFWNSKIDPKNFPHYGT